MKVSDSIKERIIQDCKKFYEQYKTLNEIAVKKHNSSLHDRIKKYYGDLNELRKSVKNLPDDNGTKIWTFNNDLLSRDDFPKQVDWTKISGCKLAIVCLKYALMDFLCVKEENPEKTSFESKNHIGSFYLPNFNREVIILTDNFRGEEFNKSNYAFTKCKKEFRDLLKKNKDSIVIELHDSKITEQQIRRQLSENGINLYSKFRLLSVDPPTKRNLGYCIIEYDNNSVKRIESGTHLVDHTYSRPFQIKLMADFIEGKIKQHDCKYFVSESAFGFGQENVRTLLSENTGVFQYIAELYSIPFITVSPKRFKLYVLGDDKADKEKTIQWAKKRFKLKEKPQEHESDAIAIAISFLADRELIDLCFWK